MGLKADYYLHPAQEVDRNALRAFLIAGDQESTRIPTIAEIFAEPMGPEIQVETNFTDLLSQLKEGKLHPSTCLRSIGRARIDEEGNIILWLIVNNGDNRILQMAKMPHIDAIEIFNEARFMLVELGMIRGISRSILEAELLDIFFTWRMLLKGHFENSYLKYLLYHLPGVGLPPTMGSEI